MATKARSIDGSAVSSGNKNLASRSLTLKSNDVGVAERAWAEKLKDVGLLLECPLNLLTLILLRCYPDDSADVLYQEMNHHLDSKGGGCYDETDLSSRILFSRHVELLQTLPSSTIKVADIIIHACATRCHDMEDCMVAGIVDTCNYFDKDLSMFVEDIIGKQTTRNQDSEFISLIDRVRNARRSQGRRFSRFRYEPDPGWLLVEDNPSFVETTARLAKWHARSTSLLVARNVAGDTLPVELVEMIGECWLQDVDQELKKMLQGASKYAGAKLVPDEFVAVYGCECMDCQPGGRYWMDSDELDAMVEEVG